MGVEELDQVTVRYLEVVRELVPPTDDLLPPLGHRHVAHVQHHEPCGPSSVNCKARLKGNHFKGSLNAHAPANCCPEPHGYLARHGQVLAGIATLASLIATLLALLLRHLRETIVQRLARLFKRVDELFEVHRLHE